MTLNEKRIKILEKRLDQLNSFLIEEANNPTQEQSFAGFLKGKGISRDMFIKDLPPEYHGVPANGVNDIVAYADLLNNHKLYLMLEEGYFTEDDTENMSADGGQNFGCDGCTDCPCSKKKKGFFNADGDCGPMPVCLETKVIATTERKCVKILGKEVCSNVPVVKTVPNQECIDKKNKYRACKQDAGGGALGGCGVVPVPPPVPEVAATKALWDNYRRKKADWQACMDKNKESGRDVKQHMLHLSNPMEALGRDAFLKLVGWNVFGMASRFAQMRDYPDKSFYNKGMAKWYNFGGRESKLDDAIDKGKNKPALFRAKGWKPSADGSYHNGDGGAGEIAGAVVAAAAIISAIVPLIKEFKKSKGEGDAPDEAYPGDSKYQGPPDPNMTPGADLSTGMKTGLKIFIGLSLASVLGFGIYKLVK